MLGIKCNHYTSMLFAAYVLNVPLTKLCSYSDTKHEIQAPQSYYFVSEILYPSSILQFKLSILSDT